jgi:hypothetical protein
MKTSNIIFVKKSCLTEDIIYAVDKNNFETMLESQTYDKFGQQCSHYDMGDYITLDTREIVDYVNGINIIDEFTVRHKWFSLFDCVSAYEHKELFYDIIKNKYFINGEDYTLNGSTCQAYNYWNGNNWKTHTISSENSEPTLIVLNNKKDIKRLRTAISKRKLIADTRGIKHYTHGQVELWESDFTQDSWFLFRIKY